jgi:hypothetical protein
MRVIDPHRASSPDRWSRVLIVVSTYFLVDLDQQSPTRIIHLATAVQNSPTADIPNLSQTSCYGRYSLVSRCHCDTCEVVASARREFSLSEAIANTYDRPRKLSATRAAYRVHARTVSVRVDYRAKLPLEFVQY